MHTASHTFSCPFSNSTLSKRSPAGMAFLPRWEAWVERSGEVRFDINLVPCRVVNQDGPGKTQDLLDGSEKSLARCTPPPICPFTFSSRVVQGIIERVSELPWVPVNVRRVCAVIAPVLVRMEPLAFISVSFYSDQ